MFISIFNFAKVCFIIVFVVRFFRQRNRSEKKDIKNNMNP